MQYFSLIVDDIIPSGSICPHPGLVHWWGSGDVRVARTIPAQGVGGSRWNQCCVQLGARKETELFGLVAWWVVETDLALEDYGSFFRWLLVLEDGVTLGYESRISIVYS